MGCCAEQVRGEPVRRIERCIASWFQDGAFWIVVILYLLFFNDEVSED